MKKMVEENIGEEERHDGEVIDRGRRGGEEKKCEVYLPSKRCIGREVR